MVRKDTGSVLSTLKPGVVLLSLRHYTAVHSRFSTNTFPSWDRAQPLRMLGHNGEGGRRRS